MIKVTIDAPDDILGVDTFIQQSVAAVNDTVDDTLADFNKSKKDFSSKNQFQFDVAKADKPKNGIISGSVETDNENYVRLNNGFVIPAVVGRRMSFRPGYNAKTARGVIDSRSGGPFGQRIVRTKRRSSTVEGRQFDIVIRNANITKFYDRVLKGDVE